MRAEPVDPEKGKAARLASRGQPMQNTAAKKRERYDSKDREYVFVNHQRGNPKSGGPESFRDCCLSLVRSSATAESLKDL